MLAYIYTPNGVSIALNGRHHSIAKDDVRYLALVEAIENKFEEFELEALLAPPVEILAAAIMRDGFANTVTVDYDAVYYNGEAIHNTLTIRILQHLREGIAVTSLVRFLEKLMQNPSYRAVQDLYTFLEVGKIPLTPDGDFLVYKAVRSNWKDIHSGTFDNSIGQIVEVPRNKVDEDSNRTCSYGLHVCSFEYLPHFSHANGHVIVCKVNPADVVAIPADYNNTKMRVSRYEVVGEVDGYYGERRNILSESLVNTNWYPETAVPVPVPVVWTVVCHEESDNWDGFNDEPIIEQEFDSEEEAQEFAREIFAKEIPFVIIKRSDSFDEQTLRWQS